MSYHREIAGTYEPTLVAIFNKLNETIFEGKLPMPDALAYDYRHVGTKTRRGRGGQIWYNKVTGHVWYIVVRGKLKGNTEFETLTMLHEMVHLSLIVQFFNTDLPSLNYRVGDFTTDKSASFILECAKVADKYGCSYKELAKWDTANNPDQETSITTKSYNELQDAKSLLGLLA